MALRCLLSSRFVARRQTFHLLGPFAVQHDGEPINLGGRKQRLLLCNLALRRNEPVAIDVLVDAIWPTNPPAKPGASLRSYVSNLRKLLAAEGGAEIVGGESAYTLRADKAQFDVYRFQALQSEASTALDPHTRLELLNRALALVTGEPLTDMVYEDFAHRHIDSMSEGVLAAHEDRADCEIEIGNAAAVIGELADLIGNYPTRERLRGIHMRALYSVGRQAEALESFQRYREAIVEQLGIEPGPALLELESQILTQSDQLSTAPPTRLREPTPDSAAPLLVGRAAQQAAIADLFRNQHGFAVLVGDAGSGKSALLDHAVHMHSHGWRVASGHCLEDEGVPTLWPWRAILRSLSAGAALLPTAESDFYQLIEAISDVLLAAATSQPVLITIEDLHWADADTLCLLAHLTQRMHRERIVILATSRTRPPPLMSASATWVDVTRLGLTEVAELVEMISGAPCEDRTAQHLHRRTGGSALFVSEIARAARLDGREVRPDDQIPGHVRDLVLGRLNSFGPDTLRSLQAAALVAGSFAPALLADALAIDEIRLIAALEPAHEAQMIAADPSDFGRYRFTHAVLRETVQSSISPSALAAFHGQLGEALENAGRRSAADAAQLSRHYALAGPGYGRQTIEWARAAALSAKKVWAFGDVVLHLRRALEAHGQLEAPDPQERCELLLDLVEASRVRLSKDEAVEERYEAYRIAESLDDYELLGRAALTMTSGMGSPRSQAHRAPTASDLHLVERALTRLPDDAVQLSARLKASLAADSYSFKPVAERTGLFDEAATMAQESNDPALYARVLLQRRVGVGWTWTSEQRSTESRSILELAKRHDMADEELLIRQHLIIESLNQGDWRQCVEAFDELQAAAHLRGSIEWKVAVRMWEMTLAHLRGDWEEIRQVIDQATDPQSGFGAELGLRFNALGAFANSYQGDYGDLEGLLRMTVPMTNRRYFERFLFATLVGAGHWDEARQMLRDLDMLSLDGGNLGGQHASAACCEPLVRLGELDHLPAMLEQFEPIQDQLIIGLIGGGWVTMLGTMRYAMARATVALKRFDEAERHIGEGRAQLTPLTARPFLLELDLAEAALVMGRDGPAAAAPYLDTVMAGAIDLGMKGIATQVDELRAGS